MGGERDISYVVDVMFQPKKNNFALDVMHVRVRCD